MISTGWLLPPKAGESNAVAILTALRLFVHLNRGQTGGL
jgi:hypothetical protein